MSTFGSVQEAVEYFKNDKFAYNSGMVLEDLGEDFSVCSMELDERHLNANGGIMGGVMFTLADLAFAALSNNIHRPTVAQQVSINYLAAPKGKNLKARAELIKSGRSSTIIQVKVTDEMGREIALFTGTGFKL
ncbi:MAG: PaaI family thioesterase [Lachnospiraceae bacterium]|nr:PaaI family thioesterase [Lachnospiraceae bacterium]